MASSNLEKYTQLVRNMLPQGIAWENVKNHPMIEGLAAEFCRVGDKGAVLLQEIDPAQATAGELLSDWFTMVGLPDECTPDDLTDQDKRDQVIQKLATVGAINAAFYESVGLFFGFDITVTDHVPFRVGNQTVGDDLTNSLSLRKKLRVGEGTVGDQLSVDGWLYFFNAELPLTANNPFRVGEHTVGQELVQFGNELLECTLKKLKPAHTGITFTFK